MLTCSNAVKQFNAIFSVQKTAQILMEYHQHNQTYIVKMSLMMQWWNHMFRTNHKLDSGYCLRVGN